MVIGEEALEKEEREEDKNVPVECPYCGSVDIEYNSCYHYWMCHDCEKTFPGDPPY